MSEQGKRDMSSYVIRLKSETGHGLGVIVNGHILTCAHLFHFFAVDKHQSFRLRNRDSGDESIYYYIQGIDGVLDFMILGDAPIGFSSAFEDSYIPEIFPEIRPALLVFPDHEDYISFPVYFYEPDGKTVRHTEARAFRDSAFMDIGLDHDVVMDHRLLMGSSGGPIFTEDHKLVGILQGYEGVRGMYLDGTAVRIDMAATGWLREHVGGFDRVVLADIGTVLVNPLLDECV